MISILGLPLLSPFLHSSLSQRKQVVVTAMFGRFTWKSIKDVALAQLEAKRLGHNCLGTEQILWELISRILGSGLNDWERCRAWFLRSPIYSSSKGILAGNTLLVLRESECIVGRVLDNLGAD